MNTTKSINEAIRSYMRECNLQSAEKNREKFHSGRLYDAPFKVPYNVPGKHGSGNKIA